MKRHVIMFACVSAIFPTILILAGCGATSSRFTPPPGPTSTPISVSISPDSVSLGASEIQQFAAAVTNTSNTAVTWSLRCTASECGTISASGLYTAPSLIPEAVTVDIIATSQADSRAYSTAWVNQVPLSVQISPLLAMSMREGATQTFTASIDKHPHQDVTWSLSTAGCQGSACGTLTNVSSSSATYTAPSLFTAPATVLVIAESVADPTKSQAVKINLMPMSAPLNGRYAFIFRTSDSSTIFAASLIADGKGSLSGTGDLVTAAGVQLNQAFTGTYTLGGDHRGSMQITGAGATLNLRFAMTSGNFGQLLDFCGTSDGNGWFERQNESAFSDTTMAGSQEYLLAGTKGSAFMSRVGDVRIDSACGAHGYELVNDTTNNVFPGGYGSNLYHGSCTVDPVTGRGTLNVIDSWMPGVPNKTFYIVDVTHALMLADTNNKSMRLSGTMGAFSGSALSGDYTYYVVTPTGLAAGRFTVAPGTDPTAFAITGTQDAVDDAGAVLDIPVNGQISPDGVSITVGNQPLIEPWFLRVANSKWILSGNGFYGEAYLQHDGPFSSASFTGDFGLQLFGRDAHAVGMANFAPPVVTGTTDISNTGLAADATVNGTISFISGDEANISLGTAATGTLPFRAYVISPEKLLLLSTLPGQVTMGWAEKEE
jgi:hypothetical protein